MDRASARWRTKRTAASQPSFPARSPNSLTCRAPLSVTASGKRATPSFTRVTLFTSRTSCLPSSRDSRKSKRDLPMVTSDRSSFLPPTELRYCVDGQRPADESIGERSVQRDQSITLGSLDQNGRPPRPPRRGRCTLEPDRCPGNQKLSQTPRIWKVCFVRPAAFQRFRHDQETIGALDEASF